MASALRLVLALAVLACAAPGEALAAQIDIGGGRQLYLRCAGSGSPTVLMDSGIHDSSDTWTITDTEYPVPSSPSVFRRVARFTRVCIYDRPGTIRYTDPPALTTRSTPVPMPRKLPDVAADIHKLLRAAGMREPIVIVGHSMGGLIDRYFAQTYRKQVAGMVLVDAFGPAIKPLMGRLWPRYRQLVNAPPGTDLVTHPGWEALDIDGGIRAVKRAKPLPRMPLAVVSKTEQFGLTPDFPKDIAEKLLEVWPITQNRLVPLQPQTPHILATGSDHYVQLHDPDLVTSAIRLIVDRVRRSGAKAGAAQAAGGSLFAMSGQSGELRPVGGQRGRYDLVLRGVGHVTSFTDRPVRRADTLSLGRLVRRWRAFGFVDDPPNAALVLADAPTSSDAVVLELGRPRVLRGGGALVLRARLVPGRKPDALARFVSRADRRVPVRFGRASLFIDPSGQQRVTVAFSVSGLGNSILSMDLTGPWKMSQLEVEFHQSPVTLFATGPNGFALTGGNTPAPSIGFTLVATGTGNAVTGVAQVPPGVTVHALAPSEQTITSGQFSLPIP